MKKTSVKVLSLLLALAMLSGTFATISFAEEATCPGEGKRHTLANTSDYTKVKEYAPVCDNAGYTSYTCNTCGDPFVDSFVAAPNSAHEWGTEVPAVEVSCDADGSKAYQQCANCEKYLVEGTVYSKDEGPAKVKIEKLGHNYVPGTPTGTCEEKGEVVYTCSNCGDSYAEEVEGTGEGHKWVLVDVITEPTVDEDGNVVNGLANYKCANCEGTFKKFPVVCSHKDKVELPAVESDCDSTGLTAGEKCAHCGYITTPQTVTAKKGHTTEVLPYKAPTCTETGLTEGLKCTTCGEILTAQTSIPVAVCNGEELVEFGAVAGDCDTKAVAAGKMCPVCDHVWEAPVEGDFVHDPEVVRVEPTCTNAGYEAEYCKICEETIGQGKIISALGHIGYDEAVELGRVINTTPASCTVDGKYTWTCGRDGCTQAMSKTIDMTGHNTIPVKIDPTCSMYGYTYSYCTNANCTDAQGNVVNAVTEVLVDTVYYSVAVEGAAVKYQGDIKVDVAGGYNANNHSAPKMDTIINAPTCTDAGHGIAYCEDCDYYNPEAEIPAKGHTYTRDNPTWSLRVPTDPTCTEKGYTTYTCADCSHSEIINVQEGDEVAATGHTEAPLAAVAPDCENPGLTAGTYCSVCTEILVPQTPVNATGHAYTYDHTVAPKCDGTQGYDVHVCGNDNCPVPSKNDNYIDYTYDPTKTYESVVEANKIHTLDPLTEQTLREKSCTVDGLIQYTCTDCGKNVLIVIAKGHNWGTEEPQVDPTCDTPGTTAGKTCLDCGATEGFAPIAALGHSWATVWSKDATNHWYACTNDDCTAKKDLAEHEYTSAVTTAPTCDAPGVRTFTCICGDSYTEAIDPTGHDFADKLTYDDDYHWYECENEGCDAIDGKAEHTHTSEVILAPTCTETGTTRWTCECGNTYDETTGPNGHNFVYNDNSSTLGCATDQYDEYECADCGIVELRNYYPAYGHDRVIDEAVAPDCDDTGLTEGWHCANGCDATLYPDEYKAQEVVPATGKHMNANGEIKDSCLDTNANRVCAECGATVPMTHHDVATVTVEATCVDMGYTVKLCKDCGEWLEEPSNIEPATGVHIYGDWEVTTDPTCTLPGEKTQYCENCDDFQTEPVDATGHTAKAELEKNADQHWAVCKDCGVTIEGTTKNHTWNNGQIIVAPQPNVPGETLYTCTACGQTKTEYPAFAGIKVSFDYDSGIVADAAIVNGGLVVVKVYLEGTEAKVENVQIKFNYAADRLTWVSTSYANAEVKFDTSLHNVADGNATIFLAGDADNADESSMVTVNGKKLVAELTFRVDDYADVFEPAGETPVNATTTAIDGFAATYYTYGADATVTVPTDAMVINIAKLGAVSTDAVVDGFDCMAIKDIIAKDGYMAEADINKDGFVDGLDYLELAKYNAGMYTYEDFTKIGK